MNMSMTSQMNVLLITTAFWEKDEPKKVEPKPSIKKPVKESYESDFDFGSVKSEKSSG